MLRGSGSRGHSEVQLGRHRPFPAEKSDPQLPISLSELTNSVRMLPPILKAGLTGESHRVCLEKSPSCFPPDNFIQPVQPRRVFLVGIFWEGDTTGHLQSSVEKRGLSELEGRSKGQSKGCRRRVRAGGGQRWPAAARGTGMLGIRWTKDV